MFGITVRITEFDDLRNEGVAVSEDGKKYTFCLEHLGLPDGGYYASKIIGLSIEVRGSSYWDEEMIQVHGDVIGLDPVKIRDEFHEDWLKNAGLNVCTGYAYINDHSKRNQSHERIRYLVYLADKGSVDCKYEEYLKTPEGLYKRALWELGKIPNFSYGYSFANVPNASFEEKYLLMPDVTGDEETKALFSLLGGSITFNRDGSWDYHVSYTKYEYHDTIHLLGKRLGVTPTQYGNNSNYKGHYYLVQKA